MEMQSPTNFSMLTERLHILFKRYIINGRVRAPPEFELRDMIPTFQQGAKTNRRALQSKFKSWSKRMTVISGNLVLSSSGKIIIPQERCDEIIMEFHRDDHMGINKVITQIQKKYTWTKKNFGMDLEIVMNAISNNCKNTACQKEIGKAIKTYCRKLFQGFPVSTVPRSFFQDANVEYADFYNSSIEGPQRDIISPTEYPILQSYLSNRYNTLEVLPEKFENRMSSLMKTDNNESYKNIVFSKNNENFTELLGKNVIKYESIEPKVDIPGECSVSQPATFAGNQKNKFEALWSTPNKKRQYFPKSIDARNGNKSEETNISGSITMPSKLTLYKNYHNFAMENDDSSRNSYSLKRSCKKPRNLYEFKKQLKDAKNYPEIYPAIFTDPKSQFLSTLGLAPKRICSKKTLTKFTKEQRKRRLMEKRRSWFMVDRKVLRDRNKLNKRNSHRLKMRYETYGNISKPHSSSFYHSPLQNSQKIRNDNFKKLKNIVKRPLRGHTEKPRMIKPQFILPKKHTEKAKKDPEIIDIASSDDESPVSQNFRDVKTVLPEPHIQSISSIKQNCSFEYADPMLFRCNAETDEAVRNQMFYEQNFGYNGVFGASNLFLSQNNVNFPVASNNTSYQHNDSFYINSQTQFPLLRPFLIPALSNNDIAILQAGNFPMIRSLRPTNSSNISPYFKNVQSLPKSTNSFSGQSGNLADDEQCLFVPNGNVATGNKDGNTNINTIPHQDSQPTSNFKVFLVNKTPKKTYLLIPPNYKAYLNTAKKTIPVLDPKQPTAPRVNNSDKVPLKYKTVAKELQQRRLNNAIFGKANYSSKQKGSKKDIKSEMTRLSNWISQVKTSVTPTNFHKGVEKFSHRLTNQLNVGITLVKGVRNALIEIEKNEENISEDAV